jgi:hypothetical protein
MKKCNYRKCNNILNFEEHQNRDYCAEEEGKKSCYMLEKIIRTKENTAIKKRLKIVHLNTSSKIENNFSRSIL